MNILHVVPSYYPATYWGGPIFSVYALNNALARQPGVALTVLTTDAAGARANDRLDKSKLAGLYPRQRVIITRRLAGSSVSPELLCKLPGLVRRADVVHLTATYSFPTLPTLLLCRLLDKPLVWSPRGAIQDAHEWEGSRRRGAKRVWERLCNLLIRKGRVLAHTTSERERAATQERVPRAAAVIVPNGVDIPAQPPPRRRLAGDRLRLMYMGRLSPKKGIENLLEAIALLNDPAVSLTIYGGGEADYTARLQAKAKQLGLPAGAAVFAGQVDGADKSAAFADADACVIPSYTENFCMVVAEALAHGMPVIASRGTPWAEVENKRCGLWVDNSPESLARAISKIRGMDLPEMGARGRDWMRDTFSWDTLAREMMALYRKLQTPA
jgi:glycosyltransferase involved in cell wall biosynthesis